jgi:hypothetical protein
MKKKLLKSFKKCLRQKPYSYAFWTAAVSRSSMAKGKTKILGPYKQI